MSKPLRKKPNLRLEDKGINNDVIVGSQSIEFGLESVIFKNDNIYVGSKGIKQLNTGQIISLLDPNDLDIGSFIGSGASGSVHLAVYKPTNLTVAVKSINIYDKDKRKQFKNDLKVLSDNDCHFLVKFYGAFFGEGSVKLVLEYMNLGSLDNVIKKVKNKLSSENVNFTNSPVSPFIPEAVLSKITQQMLNGLLHLHKKKRQLHRDIKPANILINTDGLVKLTDFGIARSLDNAAGLSNTFVGTKSYMSPERILGEEYSFSSDIWSLGLIVYEMATGQFPYNFSKVYIEHVESILKDPEPTLPDDGVYSLELQNFITRCLKKNPKERDSVVELCCHPWILKYSEMDADIPLWLAELYGHLILD